MYYMFQIFTLISAKSYRFSIVEEVLIFSENLFIQYKLDFDKESIFRSHGNSYIFE